MLYGFLVTIFVFICIFMVVVILMQASKGGGLASSFGGGGGSSVLGARGATSILQRATIGLAIIYALLCIAISLIGPGSVSSDSATQRRLLEQQQQSAPIAPGNVTPAPSQVPAETPTETPQEN